MVAQIVVRNVWDYYLQETIDEEAQYFSVKRILQLLACSDSFAVIDADRRAGCIELKIRGRCYGGDTSAFAVRIEKDELSYNQKKEIMGHVRAAYPRKTGKDWTTKKSVADVLGTLV